MKKLLLFAQSFFRRNRWMILVLFLVEIVGNFFTLLVALVAAQVCAQAIGYNSVRGQWLVAMGFPSSMYTMLYLLGGIIITRSLLEFIRRWKRGQITELLLLELRILLFEHHLDMEGPQYKQRNSSRYLLRFSGDLSSIQHLVSRGILTFTGDGILILFSLLVIAYLHLYTAIIIMLLLSLNLFIIIILNRHIGEVEIERRNRKSGLLSYVSQHFRNIITIKALNQRTPVLNRYIRRAKKLQQIGNRYHWLAALLHASAPFGVYLILWVVLFRANANVQVEQLLAIVLILLSWRSVLQRLFKIGLVWKKGRISWEKLGVLLDRPTENWENTASITQYPLGGLKMSNVSIVEEDKVILPPQNILIEKGESMHLNVKQPHHKRLIIELLAAIYPPSHGSIYIGDIPLGEHDLKAWRKRIGFVSNVFLLRGRNVLEAIVYSSRRRYKQEAEIIWKDWQLRFPELEYLKLDTRIDGEGKNLTPTQEILLQWLRLCLVNKPIWIIDESYIRLSPTTHKALDEFLAPFKKGKTILYLRNTNH